MEREIWMRKGERETACYGRDGPFARRCSKRARKSEEGKLLELGIFTRPKLGQAKHVSPCVPNIPLLSMSAPRNQIERIKIS